jgi:hypothetical protein
MLKAILISVALLVILMVVKWFFGLTFIGWLFLGTPAIIVGTITATVLANLIEI